MTAPPVTIVGFSSTDKVPGYVGEVIYAAGGSTAASVPNVCFLTGNKISGTAVLDTDILQIFSSQDADKYFGAGSELANMCNAALNAPGVTLRAMAVSPGASPVAATLLVTFSGTASSSGTYTFRINGKPFSFGIATGDTATVCGAALAAAVNATPRCAVSAASVTGAVTLTCKTPGARGNQVSYHEDKSLLAAGITNAVTTGVAKSSGGFTFAGGSVVETPTAAITASFAGDYRYYGLAQNDTSGLSAWQATILAKSGPLEGRPAFAVSAVNSGTAPTSLATTINDPQVQLLWHANGESYPSDVAAYWAAYRSIAEQADPDASYDGFALVGIVGNQYQADVPSRAVLVSLLNNGITPVSTSASGKPYIVRSITTRSLSGSNPDYSVLDTATAVVPQFIRLDIGFLWTNVFLPVNPRVADDPADAEQPRPSGVAFPKLWAQTVQGRLKDYERNGPSGGPPILVNVDATPPTAGYDAVAKRIMALVPVSPAPNQHQVGVSVRQLALSNLD